MKTKEINKMKKSVFLIRVIMIVFIVTAFSQSCTKLDEELYGEVTPDNFFQTEEEFISALGGAYTQFQNFASNDPFTLQSLSGDEIVVPTRGADWDDGGAWRRMHLHAWTYEDGAMGGVWNFGFNGVNTANRLINQFETLVEGGQVEQSAADAFISELQAVRGFFYWQLIDLFGNVPLVTDFASAVAAPATVPRKDVYDFIVADLETAVPKLSTAVDGSTYGRMNYYAGQALLAKLYLNAGVYSGTAQWSKVITACDAIINSGKYSLEANYFANFNVDNSGSSEFIFAIPYDQVFFAEFNLVARTLHYGSQYSYDLTFQPWNGFSTLEEFYNSYDDADLRKGDVGTADAKASKRGNFIAGYQYNLGGGYVMDDGFDAADPEGAPLNFGNMGTGLPQIQELGPQAFRQDGIRIGKWEFGIGSMNNMSNDYAVFRYADVLLMKAEALWRQNVNDAAALALVNQIRSRAGIADLATLAGVVSFDIDNDNAVIPGGELFNEIGREMFAENHRRQDLIRWGFFTDLDKWLIPFNNYGDVRVNGAHTTLYPIHRDKIEANPNLTQNTGY